MTAITIGKIVGYVSQTETENIRKELNTLLDTTREALRATKKRTNKTLITKINNLIKDLQANVRRSEKKKTEFNDLIEGFTGKRNLDKTQAVKELNNVKFELESTLVNIYGIELEIEELSNVLSAFILKEMRREAKEANTEERKVSFREKYIADITSEKNLLKTELQTINPVHLFTLFEFVVGNTMKAKLKDTLDLTDTLLPKSVDLFDEINIKPTTTRITGTTVRTTFPVSEQNKSFTKMEEEFLSSVDLSGFNTIPIQTLDKYRKKIFEINTIFRMIGTDKYNEEWIHIFINIYNELLGAVPQGAKKALARFVLRAIDLYSIKGTMVETISIQENERDVAFGDPDDYFDNSESLAEALA